jgi:hypothetical protein
MSLGLKERLIELIETKNYKKPLPVEFDDQINYIKSAEGNYLFDLKGNMFKVNKNELAKLEEEGIVSINRTKRTNSHSKIKKTHC